MLGVTYKGVAFPLLFTMLDKRGKRAKSLIKYGLEEIANVLLRPLYKPKFDVFKFLSCT